MGRRINLPKKLNKYNFAQLAKNEKDKKMKAVFLALHTLTQKGSYRKAANAVRKTAQNIIKWAEIVEKEGIEGLRNMRKRAISRRKLTDQQEEILKEAVLKLANKRTGEQLKTKEIKELIKDKFRINCSLGTVYNILSRTGLGWVNRNKMKRQPPLSIRTLSPKVEAIVHAAKKIYNEEKIGVPKIAKRLGVSRATLYNYLKIERKLAVDSTEDKFRYKAETAKKRWLRKKLDQYDFVQLAEEETNKKVKDRLLAMQYLKQGRSYEEVADILKVSRKTVFLWRKEFEERGIVGLQVRISDGGRKLKDIQQDIFKKAVLELSNNGEGKRVDAKDVKNLLRDKFHIHCCLATVYNILSRKEIKEVLQHKVVRKRRTLSVKHQGIFREAVLELKSHKERGEINILDVKKLLRDEFQVNCSLATVYNILSRIGVSCQGN